MSTPILNKGFIAPWWGRHLCPALNAWIKDPNKNWL
jgi:hypothetical protein